MTDVVETAKALLAQGRAEEALTHLEPITARADASYLALAYHADALKRLGRLDDAAEQAARALEVQPNSVSARHNLASLYGDLDRKVESESLARSALAVGDAPETWLVLGRALQGQNRFDEAEQAYRAAVGRRANYADAHAELAQLIWMRTADAVQALEALDVAISAYPGDVDLRIRKARFLQYAGDERGGYAALTAGVMNPVAELTAAQLIRPHDPLRAWEHVQKVALLSPTAAPVMLSLAEGLIALQRPEQALIQLDAIRRDAPDDQYAIALQGTAWRMIGDARYHALFDYDAFVRPSLIDTPPGWSDLETYLSDLAISLDALHALKTHPVGQSLRGGSQTTASLTRSDDPVIQAFFKAINGPIRRYMEGVGAGPDPLRARNTGRYRIAGCWSVRLRPNGFHADHVHPKGWLSSACYIQLPRAVGAGGKEGWIKFGQPATPTGTPMAAEHHVEPEVGRLVLFPSYMWHGTVPFSGDDHRMTIAFDVAPA